MNVSVYLGRMMRYSLNTQSDVVNLGEEINYIRNFTNILKLRYEDTISIVIEEDAETKELPIIKFILQPLVENAVKYGFVGNKEVEIKKIKTEKAGNQIIISVEDNGVGMSEEVIANLLNQEKNNETRNVLESKGSSIGLKKNVIGRLQLYYGRNFFRMELNLKKNMGTRITFRINLHRGDSHDESHNNG
ncbi:hypothetical protein GCM10020331_102600 [Ectobacillus funiculus]